MSIAIMRSAFPLVITIIMFFCPVAICPRAVAASPPDSRYVDLISGNTLYYQDVLDMSEDWKSKALRTLTESAAAMGLADSVRDIGVAGSFAAGVGRGAGDPDPSDIDFVIAVDSVDAVIESMAFREKEKALLLPYRQRMQRELGTSLKIDIAFIPLKKLVFTDPAYIYFSLTRDTMYGREDKARQNVKYVWYGTRWHRFDRSAFKRFEGIRRQFKTSQKTDDDGRMIYYIEQTGEVILRSY